ncbi:MAG: aspartate--tRNA(Asn) ligase [Termitinemataceae bacterium]|nr:MAG: aspartate--tRNA(Asn) ligase [Termitinemataceae bacterium]
MRLLSTEIRAAAENGTASVEAAGWVHRIRELGAVNFIILRDRGGTVQLVLNEKHNLTLESVIKVEGEPALNEKAPGGVEIRVKKFEILNMAQAELPYQVNGDASKIGLESILDNRILSLRNPKIRAVFELQSVIIEAFGGYLRSHGFTEIKTSKLVSGGTEGGTELFAVDYFDSKVYLAQSPQFYKEVMVASGLERVFEIAPAYRAEKHDTPRHLNEYVSFDIEMGFIDSEIELINLEKELLAHIFEETQKKCQNAFSLWKSSAPLPETAAKSPVIGYEEALKIVNDEASKAGKARIFDITPEAESLLCAWSERENGSALVFVNEFPRRYRPFYTYPLDASRTMSFDALFRGLEITTGGKRQHDYACFCEALTKFGLKPESFPGYATLLKFGCPPHGGFAVGCERLTARLLGIANVKEASLFPRDRKRVLP